MAKPEFGPDVAPSGKPASGYGEIMIRVWFTGPDDDKYRNSEVAITAPEGMPIPYWLIAQTQLSAIVDKKRSGT